MHTHTHTHTHAHTIKHTQTQVNPYTAMSQEDREKELLKASEQGEIDKVKLLLRAGVDLETKAEVRVRRRAVQL